MEVVIAGGISCLPLIHRRLLVQARVSIYARVLAVALYTEADICTICT